VAGYGRVAWDPTANNNQGDYTAATRPGTAAYEAAVEAALDGMSNIASCRMSVAFLRNQVQEAARCKIPTIATASGMEFYPIWMRETAFLQLQADPEFLSLAKSLHISELEKHPLANMAKVYIAGAVIYVDNKMWCAYTHTDDSNITAGTVEYGPRPSAAQRGLGFKVGNVFNSFDAGDKAVGFLIGPSCMTVGIGERPGYTEDNDDHGNVVEIGLDFIQSIVRNETFDTIGLLAAKGLVPTKGDFYENTSSIMFVTWSPFALAYN